MKIHGFILLAILFSLAAIALHTASDTRPDAAFRNDGQPRM